MSIAFRDFAPQIIKRAALFSRARLESFQQAVDEANAWIAAEGVTVVNVETVVLPNMHDRDEEGSQDTSLLVNGELVTSWHQFVRVWYRRG